MQKRRMKMDFENLIGKYIELEISGGIFQKGTLVDSGLDIIVLYDGKNQHFLYIPFTHVQRLKETSFDEDNYYFQPPAEKPIETDVISFRKALTIAKGLFVQVYVTGNISFHGYLTSIMNDYFVFHSPLYKAMFISMNHVKWIIPYPSNTTPYSLDKQKFQLSSPLSSLARSFEEQLKKVENQLVILDGGDHSEKIGLLQKVQDNKAILITAEGEKVYRNLEHIKTIQLT
jgi:hypothetical protein